MCMRKLKRLLVVLCCILVMVLSVAPYQVRAVNATNSIDITVLLMDDGSAQITQIWDSSRTDGTEAYIVQSNMGDIEITDFHVSDETGTVFETVDAWQVDASREAKANKCGINKTSDGLELCWGIGSYGEHVYTINYTMTNFIKQYADNTYGFYSRFVNDALSDPPKEVRVTIQRPGVELSADNAGIWGFGYEGDIEFVNGSIIARNSERFTSKNHVTILTRLDSDIVKEAAVSSQTFDEVESLAKKGSDYDDRLSDLGKYPWLTLFWRNMSLPGALFLLFYIVIIFRGIFFATKRRRSAARIRKKRTIKPKEIKYYRDIPMSGDLFSCNYALSYYRCPVPESNLIGAHLLSWIKQGYMSLDIIQSKGRLGIGIKKVPSLILNVTDIPAGETEKSLFRIMVQAAGADRIMQEKELKNWVKENYTTLSYWFNAARQEGERQFADQGWMTTDTEPAEVNDFGRQESLNLLGFKRYLEDFTLVNEREAREVHLWDEYLIFAALFGCAEVVVKQFKELNPQYIQSCVYTQNNVDVSSTYDFVDEISRSSYRAMDSGRAAERSSSSSSRSSGSGGRSSSGGGSKGASGGGSGGGFR